MIPECPFSSGDFADHVDSKGRYVREWRNGHRPAIEISQSPEAFDPPFGSGDVLVPVDQTEGGVPIYALSREHLEWVRRQAFKLRMRMEIDACCNSA